MTQLSREPSKRLELLTTLGGKLRRVGIATVMFHEVVGEKLGLNATDSRAWSLLKELGPMPAGRLAQLTGLSTGAITTIIDRLERAGFARRAADPRDRRRVIVQPVKNAAREREIARIFGPFMTGIEELMSPYGDEDLVLILDFVDRAAEFLRERTVRLRKGESDT